MQKKFKVIFLIGAVLLIFFFLANILIGIYAPKVVEQQIEQNLKLKASLGKIGLSLPFTVTLERLEIGNLASIKKISLTPDLIALLFGKIVIHGLHIVEPVINLEQSADGKLNLPVSEQKGKSSPPVAEQKGTPPAIYLTGFNLRNGKIIFTDRKVDPKGFQVIIGKLNVKVAKVSLPITSLATNFSMNAELINSQGSPFGKIDFNGWLDYSAKDLDAKLEVRDMDLTNLSRYYGNFISNRKLSQAILDLNSTFKAKNNALQIITHFNLSKLIYAQTEMEQRLNLDLTKNALDLFTGSDGNLNLEFKINTLLDKPALDQKKIYSIILKAAAKNLANQSGELVDKVVNAMDKYKGLGKELKNIFGQ
jgi:uncharacterized protein involved in outer membrane biogenesis